MCVIRRGSILVDAAAGRFGPVDPRPVRPDSLFQLFGAGSPLLTTIALQQAVTRGGALWLQTPLANLWPAFAARGKEKLTLLHLLSHVSGLHAAFPPEASLAELCDTQLMVGHVAGAASSASNGAQHEGLPWGCALWGLLQACTGQALPALLERRICARLGLPLEEAAAELLLSLPPNSATAAAACEARVVTHDASNLLKRSGLDLSEVLTSSAPAEEEDAAEDDPSLADEEAQKRDGGGDGSGGGDSGGGGGGMMGGPQASLAPHFLNMRRLRCATLPGVSLHGSARALATFYDGVGSAKLLPAEVVAELPRLSAAAAAVLRPAAMRAPVESPRAVPSPPAAPSGVRWAAGFQLGEVAATEDGAGAPGQPVLGHGAVGGTVGLLVPHAGVAIAITVSKLAAGRAASQRVVSTLLEEFGLHLTKSAGLLPEE